MGVGDVRFFVRSGMESLHRKCYQKLLEWKNSSQSSKAILINGARRVGKSYLAEEFARNEYKSYILIDFSSVDESVFSLFERFGNKMRIDEFFNQLSVIFSVKLHRHDSAIIFDEVQKFPKAREFIKQLVADDRYDYIETGSLIGLKKNVENIVLPSEEEQMNLYPLDFEEFLWALGDEVTVPYLRDCLESKKPLGNLLKTVNEKLRMYMIIGGMPQSVVAYLKEKKYDDAEKAKQNILTLYREDIAKYAGNYTAEARAVFDAIPAMLSHHDKKVKFSSLGLGDRFSVAFANAVFWLKESMVVNLSYCIEEPALFDGFALDSSRVKCYMGDTGLLLSLAAGKNYITNELYKSFVLGKLSVNKGMMTENIIAQMLSASNHPLRFYEKIVTEKGKKHKYELDFLLKKTNKLLALEVKSGNCKEHASLDYFSSHYRKETSKPFILTKGDFKETDDYVFMPLVMAMFL